MINLVGSRQWKGSYTDIPAMGYDGSLETSEFCNEGDIPYFLSGKRLWWGTH